jgi:hypothetical protein
MATPTGVPFVREMVRKVPGGGGVPLRESRVRLGPVATVVTLSS